MNEEKKDIDQSEEAAAGEQSAAEDVNAEKEPVPDRKPERKEKRRDKKKESDRISELTEELAAANDKYLRLCAEYDNFRRRSQKEKDALYGDIRADVDAENVTLQSMSGDIHWSGVAQKLNASSISGDLEIEGRMKAKR